jgi:glucosamine-phosphate N-acetyltransferase
MQRLDGSNLIVVIEEKATGKLVATGTLAVELKFVHSCGHVGHIEDIVCDEAYRGKQLGRRCGPCPSTPHTARD